MLEYVSLKNSAKFGVALAVWTDNTAAEPEVAPDPVTRRVGSFTSAPSVFVLPLCAIVIVLTPFVPAARDEPIVHVSAADAEPAVQ